MSRILRTASVECMLDHTDCDICGVTVPKSETISTKPLSNIFTECQICKKCDMLVTHR